MYDARQTLCSVVWTSCISLKQIVHGRTKEEKSSIRYLGLQGFRLGVCIY